MRTSCASLSRVMAGDHRERLHQNRHAWDLRTRVHLETDFYDVGSFRQGASSLRRLEQEELGDVRGRSLLHLMCHFGLDTLSWARLGARVTGADFSEEAIAAARALASELAIDARFVCSDLYALPDVLDDQFDIVVTTYGVLSWLPDIDGWARVVARYLRPGGTFCLVEIHPMMSMVDEVDGRLEVTASLFDGGPFESVSDQTYADGRSLPPHPIHTWQWPISTVVTALCHAGLRIERLREVPVDVRRRLPGMIRDADGGWRLPGDPVPVLYSCVATRPA